MNGHGVAVFGGASGLGAATATRLAAVGAEVVIADVNPGVGKPFAESIGAQFVQADVTDDVSTESALDLAHQAAHGLRVAVNCAGILGNGRLLSREGARSTTSAASSTSTWSGPSTSCAWPPNAWPPTTCTRAATTRASAS